MTLPRPQMGQFAPGYPQYQFEMPAPPPPNQPHVFAHQYQPAQTSQVRRPQVHQSPQAPQAPDGNFQTYPEQFHAAASQYAPAPGKRQATAQGQPPVIVHQPKTQPATVHTFVCFKNLPNKNSWAKQWETCEHVTMSISPEEIEKQIRRHDDPKNDLLHAIADLGKYKLRHLRKYEDKLNKQEKDSRKFVWVVSCVGSEKPASKKAVVQQFWAIYTRTRRRKQSTGADGLPARRSSMSQAKPQVGDYEIFDLDPVHNPDMQQNYGGPQQPGVFPGYTEVHPAPQTSYMGRATAHGAQSQAAPAPAPLPGAHATTSRHGQPMPPIQSTMHHPQLPSIPIIPAPPPPRPLDLPHPMSQQSQERCTPILPPDQKYSRPVSNSHRHQPRDRRRSISMAAPRRASHPENIFHGNHKDIPRCQSPPPPAQPSSPLWGDDKMNRTDMWVECSISNGSSGSHTSSTVATDIASEYTPEAPPPPPPSQQQQTPRRRYSVSYGAGTRGKDYHPKTPTTPTTPTGVPSRRLSITRTEVLPLDRGRRNSMTGNSHLPDRDYLIGLRPSLRRTSTNYDYTEPAYTSTNNTHRPATTLSSPSKQRLPRYYSNRTSPRARRSFGYESNDYEYESAGEVEKGRRTLKIGAAGAGGEERRRRKSGTGTGAGTGVLGKYRGMVSYGRG